MPLFFHSVNYIFLYILVCSYIFLYTRSARLLPFGQDRWPMHGVQIPNFPPMLLAKYNVSQGVAQDALEFPTATR